MRDVTTLTGIALSIVGCGATGSYNRNLWMHHLIGDATYLPL